MPCYRQLFCSLRSQEIFYMRTMSVLHLSSIVNNFRMSHYKIENFPLVCLSFSDGTLSCFILFLIFFKTVPDFDFFLNTSHLAHKLNAQKTREKLGELKIRAALYF